jgi:hypothetical protein
MDGCAYTTILGMCFQPLGTVEITNTLVISLTWVMNVNGQWTLIVCGHNAYSHDQACEIDKNEYHMLLL